MSSLTISRTPSSFNALAHNYPTLSLHEAIRDQSCSINTISSLLYPSNIDTQEKGQTPLLLSIEEGRLDIAKLLIENGANTNVLSDAQESPLHIAVFKGYQELVEILLNQNRSLINLKMQDGFTPLHLAVLQNQPNLVRILLHHKADPFVFSGPGFNPFHLAIISCNEPIVELFISSHPTIANSLTRSGLSSFDLGNLAPIALLDGDPKENLLRNLGITPES